MCAASSHRFVSPHAGATLWYIAGPSPAPYQPTPKPSPLVVSAPIREWRLWSISPCCVLNSSSSINTGCPDHAIHRHISALLNPLVDDGDATAAPAEPISSDRGEDGPHA